MPHDAESQPHGHHFADRLVERPADRRTAGLERGPDPADHRAGGTNPHGDPSQVPNGEMLHARVFLVRHNDVLGPAKGGIRMTPTVNLNEVTGLAMEMTWKTSLIGVPFGGGKAGIRYDPAAIEADGEGDPHPGVHPRRAAAHRAGNLRARPRHGHQRTRHGPHPRLHLL